MLLVKTKIGPSKIAGIGLFADQFISKGTPVWKFVAGFDQIKKEAELSELSEVAKAQFLNYIYHNKKTGDYILCFDDARFFNHSDDPNCVSGEDDDVPDIAVRDIQPGEEMTNDYRVFDSDFVSKIKK
jgi:SET domain-containing protein